MKKRLVNAQRGFTLVELIMVMVLMGVIAGMVVVFMKSPIDAYFASARRAALTDTADTAARRIARDLQKALPNSIRTPNSQCLEFIPTKTGGRYRADESATALNFSAADDRFDMLGDNSALPANQRIVAGDVLVVYNLGITGADAYLQDNTAAVSFVTSVPSTPVETRLVFAGKKFPFDSDNKRFHVVPAAEKVVAYVCSGGLMRRTVSSTFTSSCPFTGPVMATNVSQCSFDYSGLDLRRNALVSMVFSFTQADETVRLQSRINVSNAP